MRALPVLAGLLLAATACQGPPSAAGGPYDDLPVDQRLDGDGLTAPVHVVIDTYGIPHILAQTLEDAAYANGYVMARDRWMQLEIFRHVASGRVAEIFGGLDPSQIDEDLRMRAHRMRPLAQETYDMLQASGDPLDQEMVRTLDRYADGVNKYVAQLKDGTITLNGDVDILLPDPENIDAWSGVDSLAIGRLLTWTLSFNDYELDISEALDLARTRFDGADAKVDPALARRAGAYFDLYGVRPLDATSTIDGFPNVDADTGTRANGATAATARAGGARRPTVPRDLMRRARAGVAPPRIFGGTAGRRAMGSNNWVVGPSLAGGATILANDPHLPLTNPPFWYFLHLTVPGQLDVEGAGFPGVPGMLLGHNEHFAWGATVVYHDANDYYLEELAPCAAGGGSCVAFGGADVPVETWTEEITVGTLGIPQETFTATYQRIPHHGPLIPRIEDHRLVEQGAGPAMSMKYTGHEPTFEVRAFYKLNRASSRAEGFEAVADVGHGAQNFVMIDDQGGIGWSSMAHVPLRNAGCYGFSAENPDAPAPFLVQPSDGSCEWEGFMDPRYVPHAVDPDKGYLATANADPVGATFDGNPLNGPVVDGRPLYAGATYDVGYRVGRITRLLEEKKASGVAMTMDDMSTIQNDAHSNLGEVVRPAMLEALDALAAELATPGTHPDLTAYAAALPEVDRAALADARARIAAWTLDTPAADAEDADAATIADSVATTLFNTWAVRFMAGAFADELTVLETGISEQIHARAMVKVLVHPDQLTGEIAAETGESILCDDLMTTDVFESCTFIAVRSMRDAIAFARTTLGDAPADWRWGKLHTVRLGALTPQDSLALPIEGGFPRHGDMFNVDVANHGLNNDNYTYADGPSMRHVTRFDADGPHTTISLPGGQVFDPDSPHFGDLMELWRRNETFVFPWTPADVRAKVETHLVVE